MFKNASKYFGKFKYRDIRLMFGTVFLAVSGFAVSGVYLAGLGITHDMFLQADIFL
jgi:hypothetical protein